MTGEAAAARGAAGAHGVDRDGVLSEADVLGLARKRGLNGRQVGADWRFLKVVVQDWLRAGSAAPKSNKEAWLALAGAWKDDPDLETIVEEAYRRRGRPITEDGSYKNFSSR